MRDYGKIKGRLQKQNSSLPLELIISKKGKKAKLNHLEQQKLSQYIGEMNVVMFAPEDLNLVKGSPQVRRRFFDMEIGQISPVYLYDLSQYQKVLTQRNHLLKNLQGNSKNEDTMLDVLYSSTILSMVQKFCENDLSFCIYYKNGLLQFIAELPGD